MEVTVIRLDTETFNILLAFMVALLLLIGFGFGQGWK